MNRNFVVITFTVFVVYLTTLVTSSVNSIDSFTHDYMITSADLINNDILLPKEDNSGMDERMKQQIVSNLEKQFLKLFGMKQRPGTDYHGDGSQKKKKKVQIPKYLMEMYEKQSELQEIIPTTNLILPGRHTQSANTIRTFYPVKDAQSVSSNSNQYKLQFNLDNIPAHEIVTGSELRILLHNNKTRSTGKLRILINDVVKTTKLGDHIMYPIDSKSVNLAKMNEDFWITFDIFPSISRIISKNSKKVTLILQILDANGSELGDDIGLKVKAVKQGTGNEEESYESPVVLFTYSDYKVNKKADMKVLSRQYRAATANPTNGNGNNNNGQRRRNPNRRNKNRKRNLCTRHKMFVDFTDVGWGDWVLAPPGYHAYHCMGECPFPMAEHLNATNHAVIQALMHSMNPAQVPPPCCVPTKYSSLSLLYADSSDKIILKNYNEMVVDSCGCS